LGCAAIGNACKKKNKRRIINEIEGQLRTKTQKKAKEGDGGRKPELATEPQDGMIFGFGTKKYGTKQNQRQKEKTRFTRI